MFFSSNKGDRDTQLVVDVGTGSIGVALVRTNGETPEVVAMRREVIPFQEKLDVPRFIDLMKETLDGVIDKLAKDVPEIHPGDCSIALASPWYVAQTRLVHLAQNEPFAVTVKTVRQLVDQEVQLFLSSTSVANHGAMDKQVLIDAQAVSLRLNGYSVHRAIGRSVRELDVALYCAMMPELLRDGFKEVVQKRFGDIPVRYHAFMFSIYNAIRDHFTDEASYLIVDIAGEATDVALVRDDVLLETFSFPMGHRSVLRTAMRELGLDSVSSRAALDLYLERHSTPEHDERMEPIVAKALRDWQRLFRGALSQISEQYPVPREMYLLSDERYRAHYERELFDAGDEAFKETGERFRIESLDRKLLEHFVHFPDGSVWDGFLCVIIMMTAKLRSLNNSFIKTELKS